MRRPGPCTVPRYIIHTYRRFHGNGSRLHFLGSPRGVSQPDPPAVHLAPPHRRWGRGEVARINEGRPNGVFPRSLCARCVRGDNVSTAHYSRN
ncbi:hypothetical protein NDU88_001950 [Pleurodeles waltl]|uniref:Uncharacterized protein n=1 Tax=Pleurodeles waltl TaxID=8319 RepID=A0AAV7Q562_PLEWA|nr:hypothetical protein NDU88_001950 [Pleurodeles waltl]